MAYLRQRGMGLYENSGDWEWEYYPPPYDFLAPRNSAPMPAPIIGGRGMGGCGCGGSCGGCGGHHSHGMGLFDSGLDTSGWGIGEYAAVAAGVYFGVSIIGDLFKGVAMAGRVKKAYKRRSAKSAKRASLRRELDSL